MLDGDEWKREAEKNKWNNPRKIAIDEYTSILNAHNNCMLRPIVEGQNKIDKDAVALVESDLECKINDPDFEKLSLETKKAYHNFMRFVQALKMATDEEVEACREVLKGLLHLGINCNVYGEAIAKGRDELYYGRDPCREEKYRTFSAIQKAEKEGNSSGLLKAARQMAGTCTECPYK